MNFTEKTTDQLKVLAYDLSVQVQKYSTVLQEITKEIQNREANPIAQTGTVVKELKPILKEE